MKEWLKNNVVGIAFGILGSISFIGSVVVQVQNMAAAYANVFWWWTAAMVLLGIAAGVFAAGLGKRKSEDRLASVKESEATKRRAKAEEEATKRAQIQADKELELERTRNERADLERERERARKEDEKAAERSSLIDRIVKLPYREASVLLSAIEEGALERSRKDTACLSLEESGLLVRLDTPKNVWDYAWKAADDVRSAYDEEESIRSALGAAQDRAELDEIAELERNLRGAFRRLDFDDQCFVYLLFRDGEMTKIDDWFRDFSTEGFVAYDKAGPGRLKAYLPEKMRRFFEENEDLFKYVKESERNR